MLLRGLSARVLHGATARRRRRAGREGASIACMATDAAKLSPRQRRLAANKRKHQKQRPSQPPSQPPAPAQQQPLAEPQQLLLSELGAGPGPGSDWQAVLSAVPPQQLVDAALRWAAQARAAAPQDLLPALPAVTALRDAGLRCAEPGGLERQQLADLAWALSHFDALQRQHGAGPASISSSGGGGYGMQVWGPLGGGLQAALGVPFQVLPLCLPGLALADFMAEVELRRDRIRLKEGAEPVLESRHTAWQSDIGASFVYSGKEMTGGPLTPLVAGVRDQLEQLTGQHFDSVLVNMYPDGKCGMRFHVDPLYDCWTPNTAVVSLGDTRRLVFREAANHSVRWQFAVANGDAALMWGDCQERLQHAIVVERRAQDAGPRMSLVYKQRIRRPDGSWA